MIVKADTWPDEMKTRRFDTLVARCTGILGMSAQLSWQTACELGFRGNLTNGSG